MKIKILSCLALLFQTSLARAALYVEPRFSYLHVAGTPNIGDLGRKQSSDIEHLAPEIAVGYTFSSRVGVELRYISLGDVKIAKAWPYLQIFPTNDPLLPVLHTYTYVQETSVVSLALPIKVVDAKNFTVFATPLAQRADAKIQFLETSPSIDFVAGYRFRRHETPIRGGGEVSATYALNAHAALTAHYTYLPLPGFDAHLLGAGLNFRF